MIEHRRITGLVRRDGIVLYVGWKGLGSAVSRGIASRPRVINLGGGPEFVYTHSLFLLEFYQQARF